MKIINKKSKKALSIIEVIVGIFIFSIGLTSIYMTMSYSMNLNDFNKNEIIATGLAREGMELVKNLRDSNYDAIHPWNFLNPNSQAGFGVNDNYFQTGVYYKVEDNYSSSLTDFGVKFDKIINFAEGAEHINGKMKNYELCLDNDKKYTYNCISPNTRSKFYRYVKFEDLEYRDSTGNIVVIKNSYKVIVKVIWYIRGYHETSLTTILADYKKL